MSASLEPVRRTGYAGFGSFMVDRSVEDLVTEPEATYCSPTLPFSRTPVDMSPNTPLGKSCRHLFMIDFDSWTYLNHGAFGGVCVPAYREASQWREYCERQPLRFLDRELFPHVVHVMRDIARFINSRPQDLVLLPNATTGLNVAIQSADLKSGECVYMLDIGYGSVKKMAQAACGGADVVYGKVSFPLTHASQLVDLVESTLPSNTKLAVFDAITSNTAIRMPLQDLVDLCKNRGVSVLVDGAHALGQLDIDVERLGADFYVTNCHKWLCAPRGSALMWVHQRAQSRVRPLVVSHGSGCGFVSDFIWDGCRDYAPYLGIRGALRMWKALGVTRCRDYSQALLKAAVEFLVGAWKTDTLVPLELCANMALVRLPDHLAAQRPAASADAKYVQDVLHHHHHIECPVKCLEGKLYVRISAFVYNCLEDYQMLAQAVESMQQGNSPAAAPE